MYGLNKFLTWSCSAASTLVLTLHQPSVPTPVSGCHNWVMTLSHQSATSHNGLTATSVSVVPSQSQENLRQGRAQVAGAAGAAPGCTTTPDSDPTEWECNKGYIKKEPLQPDSQSASQPLHTKHTLG
ncbi:unnamed protein product [Schistocephalus solidus]|uniref:Secreted protein n=1 Tax=Schistocephalus solidus TaxID=70667 RepID=A0A183T1V6_SCHSO|nr:unnamed protein product [Schistocephalus solidus]